MIYLRSENDAAGDVVDLRWYCSQTCYQDSIDKTPPSDVLELGGAYPCGEESDSPDYCAVCAKPVGNPLTFEGEESLRDHYMQADEDRREELRRVYYGLFVGYGSELHCPKCGSTHVAPAQGHKLNKCLRTGCGLAFDTEEEED